MILDVALPEMNGIEVTRQIRRAGPVAVLIVTMHDSDQVVQEAMEAGANGLVLKAEAGRTMADAVRAILSRGEFISERVGRVAGRSASNEQMPVASSETARADFTRAPGPAAARGGAGQ